MSRARRQHCAKHPDRAIVLHRHNPYNAIPLWYVRRELPFPPDIREHARLARRPAPVRRTSGRRTRSTTYRPETPKDWNSRKAPAVRWGRLYHCCKSSSDVPSDKQPRPSHEPSWHRKDVWHPFRTDEHRIRPAIGRNSPTHPPPKELRTKNRPA